MTNLQKTKNSRWFIKTAERQLILLLGDLLVSIISLFIALYSWAQKDQWISFSLQFLRERPPAWFYMLPFFWILLLIDLYDVRKAANHKDTIRGIFNATLVATLLYLVIFFVAEPKTLPRRGVAAFIGSAALLTLVWRSI